MGRNAQSQAWFNRFDLIKLRSRKMMKRNGKLESDADVFNRIMEQLEQDKRLVKKELRRKIGELKIKLDDKKLFR